MKILQVSERVPHKLLIRSVLDWVLILEGS